MVVKPIEIKCVNSVNSKTVRVEPIGFEREGIVDDFLIVRDEIRRNSQNREGLQLEYETIDL